MKLIEQILKIFCCVCVKASVSLVLLFAGCATLSPSNRNIAADRIAENAKFEKAYLETKNFTLTAYYHFTKPEEPVNIYIEGDGNAWQSRTHISKDPTPRNPLVLRLAIIDPSPNVAYLARPGQYLIPCSTLNPEKSYWSDRRFSEEVVVSMSEAVGQLAFLAKTDKINLIGYSGGAAIAVLVAAQRNDIVSLRTIAGNLDSDAVSKYHHVSVLKGSLNPIDAADKIKNISQRHFIGSNDKVVPVFVAESFVGRMGDKDYSRVTIIKGATHAKGWLKRWKELLGYQVE